MIAAAVLALIVGVQEKPIATLPENATDVVVNEDASKVAWIEGGRRVVVNGVQGAEFDAVRSLRLHGTGPTVAYAARNGGQWSVVSGSAVSAAFEDVGEPILSETAVAFAARRGVKWSVVHGTNVGPEFNAVSSLALSPDGKSLAYAARLDKTMVLMLGENRGPEFDEVKLISFSADGARLVYGAVHKGTSFTIEGPVVPADPVVVLKKDEMTERACASIGLFDVRDPEVLKRWIKHFAEDDKVPSIEVSAEIPWKDVRPILALCKSVGCDRVEFGMPSTGGLFETFEALDAVVFVPGMRWVACIGTQQGDRRVIAAGKQSDAYTSIAGLVAGGNRKLAYRASKGGGWFVVLGQRGKPGPSFAEVGDPVLNPDATQVAYAARDGTSWFIMAGASRSEPFDQVWTPRFNDDGNVVFAARKGREVWRKILTVK